MNEVVVAPGSFAIAGEPRVRGFAGFDPLDVDAVVALAKSMSAELVVVGPEAPLAAGVADALTKAAKIPVFGPSAAAARIESSKAFCHEVALGCGRADGPLGAFDRETGSRGRNAFARQMAGLRRGVVVKADGLAAGKGVTLPGSVDEADHAIDTALLSGPVVVEERLEGREASVIAICDGRTRSRCHRPRPQAARRLAIPARTPAGWVRTARCRTCPDEAVHDIVERFHKPILAELARRKSPVQAARCTPGSC